jgi:KaiC/GvpD/RAD55 family RecA-like ATPase
VNRDDAEDLWLAALLPAPAYVAHGLVRERHLSDRGTRVFKAIVDLYDAGWDSMTAADLRLPEDVLRSIPARAARPEAQARVAEAEAVVIAAWARVATAAALRRAADVAERDGPEAAEACLWEQTTRIKAESKGIDWISAVDAVKAWLREKQARMEAAQAGGVIGTTFEEINVAVDHWTPGRTTLVQGYTSDGKSTFTLQLMNDLALGGMVCHYISLEDAPEVFGGRLVAMHLDDCNLHALAALRTTQYGPPEIAVIEALVHQGLERLPLRAVAHKGFDVYQVVAAIMDAGRHGARVIAVDYIQKLLRPGDDPSTVLGIYAGMMSAAAAAVGAHFILVSQIARPDGGKKAREDLPEPTLFSAKGSGDLENCAETVLSPFRPEKDRHPIWEPALIIVNKAKVGPTFKAKVWWDRARALYVLEDEKLAREERARQARFGGM